MKTSKILFGLFIGIFLLAGINATSSAGVWTDGSSSATINNGSSIGFNYYFVATHPPMSVTIKLYNSAGSLVYTFLDTNTTNSYYFNDAPVLVTSANYKNPGNYYLTFYSKDSVSEKAKSITLTVNPAQNQTNNTNLPPVITSTPTTIVNESTAYSYQVVASDPEGYSLTYSLSSPSWLSINSAGLVTGTAPSVSSDTNYTVNIQVSDGVNAIAQIYTLTVKNIPPINPPSNQTLSIQFNSPTPGTNSYLFQNYIPINVTTTGTNSISVTAYLYDSSGNLINTAGPAAYSPFSFNFINLSPGTYKVKATATDNLGNSTSTETRTINLLASGNQGYTYNDVYQNYQQNPTTTNPTGQVTKTTPAFSFTFAILLFEILFILVLVGLIIFVFAKKRYS